MGYRLTRRGILSGGALGAAASLAACATGSSAALAEAKGAFPPSAALPLFGPAEGQALLSRNENPYGPSPSALSAISKSAEKGAYYTNAEAIQTLMALIAERHGVAPEQVVITTGSGEALSAIALIMVRRGRSSRRACSGIRRRFTLPTWASRASRVFRSRTVWRSTMPASKLPSRRGRAWCSCAIRTTRPA